MNRRFKDVVYSIDGNSPKEVMEKRLEAVIRELIYLEGIVELLGADEILEKHRAAKEAEGCAGLIV